MGINLGSVLMNLGGLASTDSEQVSVSSITLFVTLLCICVVLGHLLEENRWINESVNALLIGLGTGAILLLATNGVSSRILEFNEEFFFIYLLPPIIFNAGFQVKKKHFFRNFMTIMLFGAVGTMISFCVISLGAKLAFDQLNMGYLELQDYLAIGAIFAATDSVCTLQVLNQDETPFLYSLVFGEGVVNDATSVVLFNAIQKFDLSEINSIMALKFFGSFFSLFISSTLLGVLVCDHFLIGFPYYWEEFASLSVSEEPDQSSASKGVSPSYSFKTLVQAGRTSNMTSGNTFDAIPTTEASSAKKETSVAVQSMDSAVNRARMAEKKRRHHNIIDGGPLTRSRARLLDN